MCPGDLLLFSACKETNQSNKWIWWAQLSWLLMTALMTAQYPNLCGICNFLCGLNCIILDCSISCPSETKHRSIPLRFLPKEKRTKMANHPHCSSTAIYSLFTANSYVQYNWSTEHKMLPKIIPLYHEWRQVPSAVSAWIVLNHHDLVNNPESATHFPSLHTWPEISDQKRQKITNFWLSLECEPRMLQHRAL
jgi:hypothetical protein